MKIIYLTIIIAIFAISGHSQSGAIKIDPSIESLKNYLLQNIKYRPAEIKNYIEGSMIINFRLDKNKMISDVHFVRHLTNEFDSEVLNALVNYAQPLLLPVGEYTIGLKFFILVDGQPDSEIKPFDKSIYKNFLFEMNVISEYPTKADTVY